jgi:hypothetical protein
MESSAEQFENLIATRLLITAEESVKRAKKIKVLGYENPQKSETESTNFSQQITPSQADDFIKVEKNLASFGFFTPSSNRVKTAKSKTISFTRWLDGKRIEARAIIAPSALYGLPVTSDQDKWFALQHIINELRKKTGVINNPISFTSAELLKLLGKHKNSGKNYQEIAEWLDVMTGTMIISEGSVYFAGKKIFAKDRFHVFDRAVSIGKELEPGQIADKNYVWLSQWQLENINSNYLLPVDFETYKQLKNHIAKALVPLLQIWLYATREEGIFEKRYDELCQTLSITQYKKLSDIKRWFASSLDELTQHGYLSAWKIEKTSDGKAYKIVFYHGDKFHRDRAKRLEQKEQRGRRRLKAVPAETIEQGSVPELPIHTLSAEEKDFFKQLNMDFQVAATTAYELVKVRSEQVRIQLEAYPYRSKVENPAGFIIKAIKEDYALPETLLEVRRKAEAEARAAEERERLRAEREAEAKVEVEQMQREEKAKARAKTFIDQMPEAQRQALRDQCAAEVKSSDFWKSHKDSTLFESMVNHKMIAQIINQLAETEA